ncbi:hypothetical protein E2C01_020110 [Portunus trituberculatus]|uniref:Uncharacterized protein n=1 Tax=Portunus trituberculatus TaxID=210409 RepID=A0A5B7E0M7_PORTR|nr:hypothetical protein [Portunus trituberculatus]
MLPLTPCLKALCVVSPLSCPLHHRWEQRGTKRNASLGCWAHALAVKSSALKAPPYQTSRQAFEYTSTSRGQHTHHSLPYPSPNLSSNQKQDPAPAHHLTLNMPPKCPAMSFNIAKKTRKSLTLEVKLDIIHRHERLAQPTAEALTQPPVMKSWCSLEDTFYPYLGADTSCKHDITQVKPMCYWSTAAFLHIESSTYIESPDSAPCFLWYIHVSKPPTTYMTKEVQELRDEL